MYGNLQDDTTKMMRLLEQEINVLRNKLNKYKEEVRIKTRNKNKKKKEKDKEMMIKKRKKKERKRRKSSKELYIPIHFTGVTGEWRNGGGRPQPVLVLVLCSFFFLPFSSDFIL